MPGLVKTSWWLTVSTLSNLLINGDKRDQKFPCTSNSWTLDASLPTQKPDEVATLTTTAKTWLQAKNTQNLVLKSSIYPSVSTVWWCDMTLCNISNGPCDAVMLNYGTKGMYYIKKSFPRSLCVRSWLAGQLGPELCTLCYTSFSIIDTHPWGRHTI